MNKVVKVNYFQKEKIDNLIVTKISIFFITTAMNMQTVNLLIKCKMLITEILITITSIENENLI